MSVTYEAKSFSIITSGKSIRYYGRRNRRLLVFWSSPIHKRVNWRHHVRPHSKRPPTLRKDRRGIMWIERTQSSCSRYWGRTPLLRTPSTTEEAERPLALQISALFCTAAASTLSAAAAAGKVQGSSSKVQQGPASPESIVSNFYNSGTLASSSTYGSVSARREKSLNCVLFLKKTRASVWPNLIF